MEILDLQNTTELSLLQILESIKEADFTRIWNPFPMQGQSYNFFSVIAIFTFDTLYLYSISSNHYLFKIIVDCSLEDRFLLNKQVFYATFTLSHVFCELTSLRKNVFILFILPQVFLCVCKNCSNFPTTHNTTEKIYFSLFSWKWRHQDWGFLKNDHKYAWSWSTNEAW